MRAGVLIDRRRVVTTTGTAKAPVTVVITRTVREGSEEAFEAAVRAWIPRALAFPGHLGVHMIRPPHGGREYGAVLTFRSQADWAAFQRSPEYLHFLADVQQYLAGEPAVETLSGLESWFTPPGDSVVRVPPRWKMAVVTWLGVCLAVYAVGLAMSRLASDWPPLPAFLAANALVVAALTWVVMPVLSWLFRRWLTPPHEAGPTRR